MHVHDVQTVAKIRKLASTAESEYRSAVNAIQPLELAAQDLKRQLDEAMGSDKLGSMLDLEDLDVVGQKEKEMVCSLRSQDALSCDQVLLL
jgi:hypothetical protein